MKLGQWMSRVCLVVVIFSDSIAYAGFMAVGKIKQINIPVNGSFVRVTLDSPIPKNNEGCTGAEFYMAELPAGGDTRFLSTVQTALVTQKTVEMWIQGCTAGQWWGRTRLKIYDIYLNN